MAISCSYRDIRRIFESSDNAASNATPIFWQFKKDVQLVQENDGKLVWKLDNNISCLFFDPQRPNFSSEIESSPSSTTQADSLRNYEYKIYEAMYELRPRDVHVYSEYGRHVFRCIYSQTSNQMQRASAIDHYFKNALLYTWKLDIGDVHLLHHRPLGDLIVIVINHISENARLHTLQISADSIEATAHAFLEGIILLDELRITRLPPDRKWVFNRKIQLWQTGDAFLWRHLDQAEKTIRFFRFYQPNHSEFSEAEHGMNDTNLNASDIHELIRHEYSLYKWTWVIRGNGADLGPEYGRHQFREIRHSRVDIIERYIEESEILKWVVDNKEVILFRSLDELEIEVVDKISGRVLRQRQLLDCSGISVEDRISNLIFETVTLDERNVPVFSVRVGAGKKWVFSHKAKLLYKADQYVWRLFDEVTKLTSWICLKQFRKNGFPLLKKTEISQTYVSQKDRVALESLINGVLPCIKNNSIGDYFDSRARLHFLENGKKISLMQFGDCLEFLVDNGNNQQFTYPINHQGQNIDSVVRCYANVYTTWEGDRLVFVPINEKCGPWDLDQWSKVQLIKTQGRWLWHKWSNLNRQIEFFSIGNSYENTLIAKNLVERDKFCKNFKAVSSQSYVYKVALEKFTVSSTMNPKCQMDCDNWVVSLCSVHPQRSELKSGNIIGKIFGHSILVFEGVENGTQFCLMAHLTTRDAPPGMANVKIEENWNRHGDSTGAVWRMSRSYVEEVLSNIKKQHTEKKSIQFSLMPSSNSDDVNCLKWAVQTLQPLQMGLPDPTKFGPKSYVESIIQKK